jgi:putative DNA primase/helicase
MKDKITTSVAAQGRWPRILRALGIPKRALSGRNGPCIFCGGKDRARFTDFKGYGTYYCNQCGTVSGLKFLMKFHGWSFRKAADEVDRILGTNSMVSMSKDTYHDLLVQDKWDSKVHKSTQQAAVWLHKYHPERFEAWLDSRHPEVRMWWEARDA